MALRNVATNFTFEQQRQEINLLATDFNTLNVANPIVDGDFSSNGFMKRTGAGTYSVVTDNSTLWDSAVVDGDFSNAAAGLLKKTSAGNYTVDTTAYLTSETSHADVLVDGDFTSNGFMKRTSAGNYSVDTNTYLTAEADTLATVTGRGATTNTDITVGDLTVGGNDIKSNGGTTAITLSGANVTVAGNLTVTGGTTTVSSTTITVTDKNIELGKVATPSDTTADGGGITLKGATDKTFNWVDATNAWTSNQNMQISGNTNTLAIGATSASQPLTIKRDSAGQGEFGMRLEYNNQTGPTATNVAILTGAYGLKFKNYNGSRHFFFETGNLMIGSVANGGVAPSRNIEIRDATPIFKMESSTAGNPSVLELVHKRANSQQWRSEIETIDGGLSFQTGIAENGAPAEVFQITSGKKIKAASGARFDGPTNIPRIDDANARTICASDAGHCITAAQAITLPANNVMTEGDVISIYNASGGSTLTIAAGGCTMNQAGVGAKTSLTLADMGLCTIWWIAAGTCVISGSGLS